MCGEGGMRCVGRRGDEMCGEGDEMCGEGGMRCVGREG